MQLSETFNLVPELYDRARPRYPAELYDCIAEIAGLTAGARVLEIAPATGIATVALAERGWDVTAVEMGPDLAAVAKRNLRRFPNARIEVSRFEEWEAPAGRFDLVCCATAFSWLDPTVRLERCAELLRPGGWLAVWDTLHVEGGTSQFFIDVQECYERWMPGTEPGLRCERADEIPANTYRIGEHSEFELLEVRDFPVEVAYSTAGYLDLLRTYSGHIALDDDHARALYGCIEDLIETRYGGGITKAFAFRLVTARRR